MIKIKHFYTVLILFININLYATTKDIAKKNNTTKNKVTKKKKEILENKNSIANLNYEVKKAYLGSLFLPGLGQIFNGKFWKSWIIWGGFGGLTTGIVISHLKYSKSKN